MSNLYSPKDSNKILKHKYEIKMSVEKNKFNATLKNQQNEDDLTNRMREQAVNPAHKNFYTSYRRTNKTDLKNIANEVKPSLTNNCGNKIDDNFEDKNDISQYLQHSKSTKQQINTRRLPVNYKSKNITNSNKSQNNEIDASNTMDSVRYSEMSNKSPSEYIKEFLEAAARGNRDKLDELLTLNKINSINATDLNHRSALHYAVSEGRFKTVGFLLNKNIDPNILSKVKKETALHLACKKAYKRIIVSLLDNNADPNIQDYNGKTGLHVISELNSREHLVTFINHWKSPINWSLEDKTGKRATDVSSSREIRRLLNSYMNTSSAQRYNRDIRAANKKRLGLPDGNSRSRSKESGSINKRGFKYGNYKSPNKSPVNAQQKSTGNDVIIYPARNESVKRMFKNINRNKKNLYSTKKNLYSTKEKMNINPKQKPSDHEMGLNKQAPKNGLKFWDKS